MSTSFISMLYENVNRSGRSMVLGLGVQDRYNPIRRDRLLSSGLDRLASSVALYPSQIATANVFLFANGYPSLPFWDLGNFTGTFQQIVLGKNMPKRMLNLTDIGFNDDARSVMLVNTARQNEVRYSVKDFLLEPWKRFIDAGLTGAWRTGDPAFSWCAFPSSIAGLDEGQIYLSIYQPIRLDVRGWADYDASITLYCYLYRDSNGRLTGFCARAVGWVESGILRSGLQNDLDDILRNKLVPDFNRVLLTFLAPLPASRDFYTLPGNQVQPVTDRLLGFTGGDVTLVFET